MSDRLSTVAVQRLYIAVCAAAKRLTVSGIRLSTEFVPYKDIKACVKCWGHSEVPIISLHMHLHVYLILIVIEFSSLQDFAGGM